MTDEQYVRSVKPDYTDEQVDKAIINLNLSREAIAKNDPTGEHQWGICINCERPQIGHAA